MTLFSKIKEYFANRKAKRVAREKAFDLILKQAVDTPIAVQSMTKIIEEFLAKLEETRRQEASHFQDYLTNIKTEVLNKFKELEAKKDLDTANIHKAIAGLLEVFGENAKAMTNYFRIETRQAEETLKTSLEKPTPADLTF